MHINEEMFFNTPGQRKILATDDTQKSILDWDMQMSMLISMLMSMLMSMLIRQNQRPVI